MGLKEIRDLAVAGAAEASQGHIATATNKFAQAVVGITELAMDMGFKADPKDDALKAETKTAFEKALSCCDNPVVGADPTTFGKWGDGEFLKMLLKLALKYGPLFL